MSGKKLKIGFTFGTIVLLLVWITYTGLNNNQKYYFEIKDLLAMGSKAEDQGIRVKGFLVPGSVEETGNGLEIFFQLEEKGKQLKVRYTQERPDTFKDGSEVLVEGKMTKDGYFDATFLMAKCASKYQAEGNYDIKNYNPETHEFNEGTK